MTDRHINKDQLPLSFGAFKPTGHVVLVYADDRAPALTQALRARGLAEADIVSMTSEEVAERFKALLPDTSGASGFGSEIQSMRQIYMLALEGHGMAIVRVPDDRTRSHVVAVAQEHDAVLAKEYGRLTVEELL